MVPFDNDGYIYVTKKVNDLFDLEPELYDTEDQAKKAASIWGKHAKIVKYKQTDCDRSS